MEFTWSCYDCIWHTDKCKNEECDQYNKFIKDIEICNFKGKCDNTLGSSWAKIEKEIN